MSCSKLAYATLLIVSLSTANAARADDPSMNAAKSGRLMFNVKLGPAFAVYDDLYSGTYPVTPPPTCNPYVYPYNCAVSCSPYYPYTCSGYSAPGIGATGTIMLDLGIAVTSDRNGYLLFPIQFQVSGAGSFVMLPVGFQYDIRLPIRGLYLTPRISAGYAAYVVHGHRIADLGFLLPEMGVKYVVNRRWNVGLDGFSLPIFFGDFTAVSYRLLVYGGVNF